MKSIIAKTIHYIRYFRRRKKHSDYIEFIRNKTPQEVFTHVYNKNVWKDAESNSGPGSNSLQTQELLRILPGIFEKYQIRSLLDVPCGDFNWIQKIDLSGIEYTGGDIVRELVDANNARYKNEHIRFVVINLISDSLPTADMLLCRDCLVHLSNEEIVQALANIKAQNIKYLLTTSFPEEKDNKNIITGDWRRINLQISPFHCIPLEIFNENCTESNGSNKDKSLLLIDLQVQ